MPGMMDTILNLGLNDTTAEARAAFDLSREPRAIRERYGLNRFGQNCLLAGGWSRLACDS